MDQKLLFLINREWTSPALDRLMAAMSSEALWAVPLALAAIYAAIWGGFRGRVFVALALLAFGMSDGVFGRNIKRSVGRMRPHQSEFGVRQVDLARPAWKGLFTPLKEKTSLGTARFDSDAEGRSFPSNHSSNTAAVALVAALVWRRRGWLAFFPAMLVSYSRMYVGAHWPSDVLAGILLGLASALLAVFIGELIWRRWGSRIAPRAAAVHPTLLTTA